MNTPHQLAVRLPEAGAVGETVLIVPGLRNSGPAHWQSLWQLRRPEYVRVLQRDWHAPRLGEWAASLDRAIRAVRGKALLVAHSFGCLAAIHRLARRAHDVSGVLLVAPADPARFALDATLPLEELNVPAVLVASRNDSWLGFAKAREMAARLGSGFVDLGAAGHVNTESGYGPWLEGERLLARLRSRPLPALAA